MAAKNIDPSIDIVPNSWEEVPLSPLAPRLHPTAGQAASSGSPVSSSPTKWKLKHQVLSSGHIMIKDAKGHEVQQIKVKGSTKPKFKLLDLQTGETLATCSSNADGTKAKVFFFEGVVFARLRGKGADKRRWEIETPSDTFHIKPSSVFNSDFDILLGSNVVASIKSKFRSSMVDISTGQDIPFLLLCIAFIDVTNRNTQSYI